MVTNAESNEIANDFGAETTFQYKKFKLCQMLQMQPISGKTSSNYVASPNFSPQLIPIVDHKNCVLAIQLISDPFVFSIGCDRRQFLSFSVVRLLSNDRLT